MNHSPTSKRTTITLALDNGIVKELRKQAELDRSSLNSKVNSVLEKYVGFYKHAELLDSVVIPQKQFQAMLDLMDETELTKILKADGSAAVLSILNFLGIPHTLDNMIEYCFSRVIRWSGAYNSFNYYVNKQGHTCLVFEHKFGIKWSRIMAEAHSSTIEAVLQYPTEKRVMPSTVVIRVMERD
jgi:hypothetical protein